VIFLLTNAFAFSYVGVSDDRKRERHRPDDQVGGSSVESTN
jgi:hypothetical protein